MLDLFKRMARAPAFDACRTGQDRSRWPLPRAAAAAGCQAVVVAADGRTRRVSAGGRIGAGEGETGLVLPSRPLHCRPGAVCRRARDRPAHQLRDRRPGPARDPAALRPLPGAKGRAADAGRLARRASRRAAARTGQGNLELPPCTTLDEWNAFRQGFNQLLYMRFGLTVDDCVPVDLATAATMRANWRARARGQAELFRLRRRRRRLLRRRGPRASIRRPKTPGAAPPVPRTALPDVRLRLAALPARAGPVPRQQALLQRLDLACRWPRHHAGAGLAAPGQPLGRQQLRRARHSRRACVRWTKPGRCWRACARPATRRCRCCTTKPTASSPTSNAHCANASAWRRTGGRMNAALPKRPDTVAVPQPAGRRQRADGDRHAPPARRPRRRQVQRAGRPRLAARMQQVVRLARHTEPRHSTAATRSCSAWTAAPPPGERDWELAACWPTAWCAACCARRRRLAANGWSDAWQRGRVDGHTTWTAPRRRGAAAAAPAACPPWCIDRPARSGAAVSSARAWFPLHSGGINDSLGWVEVSVHPLARGPPGSAADEDRRSRRRARTRARQQAVRQVLAARATSTAARLGRWRTAVRFGHGRLPGPLLGAGAGAGRPPGARARIRAARAHDRQRLFQRLACGAGRHGRGLAPKCALLLREAAAGRPHPAAARLAGAAAGRHSPKPCARKGASLACVERIGII
jgi:hypothetical protein